MVDAMIEPSESAVSPIDPAPPSPEPSAPSRSIRTPSLSASITLVLVVVAVGFVGWNLRPGLWLQDTTPTGGDMGAHVWSPAYLRDVLLPDLRLTGWSPDWYAGFPAFTFYMVIPSLLIVILNVGLTGGWSILASMTIAGVALWIRPRYAASTQRAVPLYSVAFLGWLLVVPVNYGVAMKLVIVLGMVALPVAAWSAGKLGGLAFPGPGVLAVMTLPFLFDRSYNIYGGNLMSTMAGEFAYSLGLAIAVVYIGVVTRGIETGRHRGIAAALLALAGLTHLFAAFFALVFTAALLIVSPRVRNLKWILLVGPLSFLLSAFWVLPFFWNRSLLNDMGWGKERRYVAALWNRSGSFGDQAFLVNDPPLQFFIVLAIVGAVICGIRRVRFGVALSIVALVFAGAFLLLPEGRLWNVRLLPFYYLSVYLMAGVGIAEIGRLFAGVVRGRGDRPRRDNRKTLVAAGPAIVATLVLIVALGLPLRSLPGGSRNAQGEYSWLGFTTMELNLGPSWAGHNFRGYESTAAWGEYSLMVATMDRVGDEYGCGRSLWEYGSELLGSYGTPMSPMLLPHWTDGCIGSMEGLYFEASATTPYHFLLQSELSAAPSRAQRDLPYSSLNATAGADHLRDLGVRYYMAFSEEAVRQGRAEVSLVEIATAGPWVVFQVEDSELVVGLDHLPIVYDGAGAGGEDWLIPTVAWWEADGAPLLAGDGPDSWPHTSLAELAATSPELAGVIEADPGRVAEMRELAAVLATLDRESIRPVTVSELETDHQSISFTVDQVGSPVLVRTSYFPNWEVSGGDGPYRVAPNLMVVVPTANEVELSYGRSAIEVIATVLTLVGLLGLWLVSKVRLGENDTALWDLAAPNPLPGREEVLDGIADGSFTDTDLEALSQRVSSEVRAGLLVFGAGVAAVLGAGVIYSVTQPTADDLLPALGVFMALSVGSCALLFWSVPRLVAAVRCDYFTIDPAEIMLQRATPADPRPPPQIE